LRGNHAETPLGVARGVAAARVRLPARNGRYRLAIADLASTTSRAAIATIKSRRKKLRTEEPQIV